MWWSFTWNCKLNFEKSDWLFKPVKQQEVPENGNFQNIFIIINVGILIFIFFHYEIDVRIELER